METLAVKASFHARSISLPKREHPLSARVEEQLSRLRSSSETTTSSISNKLSDLKELYVRVDDVLQMPLTQQALFHEKNNKMMESALDGSLRLLDICSTTRDVFSQTKECLQELESSIRRRRRGGGETGFAAEVGAYMTSKKKLNKMIFKCFNNLKRMQKTCKSEQNDSMHDMLKDVEQISLDVFESLLTVISQPKGKFTPKTLMSKLLQTKNSSINNAAEGNEVQKMESELLLLCKSNKIVNVVAQSKCVLKGLESIEARIQEIVEELECVFRRLVKTRVSLLNTHNH